MIRGSELSVPPPNCWGGERGWGLSWLILSQSWLGNEVFIKTQQDQNTWLAQLEVPAIFDLGVVESKSHVGCTDYFINIYITIYTIYTHIYGLLYNIHIYHIHT